MKGLAAAGLAAVGAAAASPKTQAAYVPGSPDRFDGNLDVDLDLTVDGRIGVGTTAPGSRLHVKGGALHVGFATPNNTEGFLSLAGPAASLHLVRDDLTSWRTPQQAGDAWQLYNRAGTLRFYTPVGGNLLFVTPDGKVGLGVESPTARLDVAGSARVSGTLEAAGRVGAGTASPECLLHVRGGSVHLGLYTGYPGEGFLSLAGPGASLQLVKNNLTSWPADPAPGDAYQLYNRGGKLRFYTPDTGEFLHVAAGGAVHFGQVETAYTGPGFLSLSGVGASLHLVKSSLTSWPAHPMPGDAYQLYNTGGVLRIYTPSNGELVFVTSDGKVGLGVPAPAAKLDVGGAIRAAGSLTINNVTAIDSTGTAMRTYYAP